MTEALGEPKPESKRVHEVDKLKAWVHWGVATDFMTAYIVSYQSDEFIRTADFKAVLTAVRDPSYQQAILKRALEEQQKYIELGGERVKLIDLIEESTVRCFTRVPMDFPVPLKIPPFFREQLETESGITKEEWNRPRIAHCYERFPEDTSPGDDV